MDEHWQRRTIAVMLRPTQRAERRTMLILLASRRTFPMVLEQKTTERLMPTAGKLPAGLLPQAFAMIVLGMAVAHAQALSKAHLSESCQKEFGTQGQRAVDNCVRWSVAPPLSR